MTNICYTLEEAAEKLKFSETVLVRLSQYLKIPRVAYEEAGYISFKGDLEFSEQDLAYFIQVKERLLMGESLDDVKNRLPQTVTSAVEPVGAQGSSRSSSQISSQAPIPPFSGNSAPTSAILEELGGEPEVLGGVSSTPPGELPPMREIQDREPYEKAAEKSFERYKSRHRSSIGKVFENMLKEVGGPQPAARTGKSAPAYKPMRSKVDDPEAMEEALPNRGDAIMPFSRWLGGNTNAARPGFSQPSPVKEQADSFSAPVREPKRLSSNAVWEPLIQQAAQKPRTMNIQLKNAALLLRERTLGHSPQQEQRY